MPRNLRTKIVLEDGEAYVVAPLEFWEHMITTYKILAEDQSPKEYWLEAADYIDRWINETLYRAPVEDEGWR